RSGIPLKGVLYMPLNFNPRKSYPLNADVGGGYGGYSASYHKYSMPAPLNSASTLRGGKNVVYPQKGYLVFRMDTTFAIPYSNEAGLASIESGVQRLI